MRCGATYEAIEGYDLRVGLVAASAFHLWRRRVRGRGEIGKKE